MDKGTRFGVGTYGKDKYGTTLNIAFLRKRVYFTMRGQIAKLIIYRYAGKYGRQDVYDYVIQYNPETELQQANRLKFKAAMAAWKELPNGEKIIYEHSAFRRHRYGKNIFVKEFMEGEI